MKKKIKILEEKTISIYLDKIEKLNTILEKEKISYTNLLVVTHSNLWQLYKDKFKTITDKVVFIPQGEKTKSIKYLLFLYKEFLRNKLDRRSLVLTFGGGVVGDIVGFAAGTFMRGIDYVQIPTTLLAMVDSSIGGKTAVNLQEGKNLVGIFYQPRLTLCDLDVLKTLNEKEILNGFGEILKYALINKRIYDILENCDKHKIINVPFKENNYTRKLILECISTKLDIVKQDEKEKKQIREKLNLGHTIAHAIESTTKYKTYTHGEAVIIGLIVESFLAETVKVLPKSQLTKILSLIKKFVNLDICKNFLNLDDKQLINKIKLDKKTYQQKIFRFALPLKIGNVKVIEEIQEEKILHSLKRAKMWIKTELS